MSRDELVRVELDDGTICRMAKKAFYIFLAQGKVIRFERSDGWVLAGKNTLRSVDDSCHFTGSDRRLAV